VQAIRAASRKPARIGFAPVGMAKIPVTNSAADLAAARAAAFAVNAETAWTNSWWMDPVFLGSYPEEGLRFFAEHAPRVAPGDLELISQPVDFCGVNIYQGQYVRAGQSGPEVVLPPVGFPITAFEWLVTPEAMYWGPRLFWERYKKPIVITENGISSRDWVSLDGKVHDAARIDFTERHLVELRRAVTDGVPIEAYFHWSFIDNFEWAHGYKHRFGLVYCDYTTQERVLKDSALWYRDVIASNGDTLSGAASGAFGV
jgi:beta-glucosidase